VTRTEEASTLGALDGLRVLNTRSAHQAARLSSLLREHGACPVDLPVIEIVPVDPTELRSRIEALAGYDWIIFTSANTVAALEPLLRGTIALPKVAAIGDATASALEQLHIRVDLVPESFVAESVLVALIARGVAGKRFLLPQARIARSTLPDGLQEAGAVVDVVPVYRTQLPEHVDAGVLAQLAGGLIDIVTFTSPSTVRNLLQLLGGEYPDTITTACIGPVTGAAAHETGLRVDIVARTYSIPGLVEALVHWRNSHG
jgi:uroporphyrinogen-III synthase